jgi:DNA polymerase-3 subunit delta'
MQHPDLIVVQAEEGSRVLRIEQVREVQRSLALAPYEARYKIALFLNFQETLASVPNAMLKTLEEPPPRVIIMLTADDPDNLLPTITSRCEVIRLRPLPAEIVADGLQNVWGMPAEQARLLAYVSGGLPAVAVRMNSHPEILELRKQWLEDFCHMLKSSRADKFAFAAQVAKENKESIPNQLRAWTSLWRDVVLTVSGSSVPLVNLDWTTQIGEMAGQIDLDEAYLFLSLLERGINRIEHTNINLQLALEATLLDLPHLQLRY